jgi:hypothetical protein
MTMHYPFVLGKARKAFQSIHVQAQIKAFSERKKERKKERKREAFLLVSCKYFSEISLWDNQEPEGN